MSLTDFQRDRARFEGGKEIGNRKAHLSRTATALRKLRDDAGAPGSQLDGVFNGDELQAIRSTCQLVDRAIARLEVDMRAADHIKKAFDDHIAKAEKALRALPLDGIENTIAIAELAGQLKPYMRMYTPLEAAERYGCKNSLAGLRNAAIASLADDCAREGVQPAGFADRVLMSLPAAAAKNADLIRELNTIAVAEQMERTR